MLKYIEGLMLVILIVLAAYAVRTSKLRRSIIYLGSFSLLSSFLYVVFNAPDVAIAEAIIGCTLSVILLLTAIKKYRILTIYYVLDSQSKMNKSKANPMLRELEDFLIVNEFEPQLIKTSLDDETLHNNDAFDLLIIDSDNTLNIYSRSTSFNTDIVKDFIETYAVGKDLQIDFVPMIEDANYEG